MKRKHSVQVYWPRWTYWLPPFRWPRLARWLRLDHDHLARRVEELEAAVAERDEYIRSVVAYAWGKDHPHSTGRVCLAGHDAAPKQALVRLAYHGRHTEDE